MAKLQVIDWLEGFSRSVSGTDGSPNRSERTRLDQIRRHDFACLSDAQLRERMTFLARKPAGDSGEDDLPEVFAVVNEAISSAREHGDSSTRRSRINNSKPSTNWRSAFPKASITKML